MWQDVEVDIDHGMVGLHVTFNGEDVYDAPVYLFTESGSYLGRHERTDEYGHAGFLIPAKSYKFRVDYDGAQHWSDVVNVIAHEETDVEMPLEQLALNKTNDPDPVRFDGNPPVYKPEEIRVASIGSLVGILSHAVVANTTSPKVYYYHNYHLDTPQIMTDENGIVVWEAKYKPFGEAEVHPYSTLENNFRFPGQYYDDETGLHYNYHRYYHPMMGRYLTPDPIGLYGGINLFLYCLNDPVNWVDPEGLDCGPGKLGDLIVPDKPGGYDFTEYCRQHDGCYEGKSDNCNNETKEQCDEEFYECMKRVCDLKHLSNRECYKYAAKYWNAVDKYGGGAFEKARKKSP